MSEVRFGCQFYTWQMSGQKYVGKLPHITGVVREAGFTGIELETCMMGEYYDDAALLRDLLAERGLALGALCLVCDWRGPRETDEEQAAAERLFRYLEGFPGTHLCLCQYPGADRLDLAGRQKNAIACANAVAARAADRGLACSFHPNSPPGSVFRTEEDYRILLDGLDARVVGFCPDSGHMARGGMDVLGMIREFRPLVRHVHFKDYGADGEWKAMGRGGIDFPGIVSFLRETGYDGWIMVEEESVAAEHDPDGATLGNGRYLRETLLPLAAGATP